LKKRKANKKNFYGGNCALNLKVDAVPSIYKIHFSIKNDEYGIEFLTNDIPLNVTECNDFQIYKLNKYNILTCETAICVEKCINGTCATNKTLSTPVNISIKKINSNTYCSCNPGYTGDVCDKKVYENYGTIFDDTRIVQYSILGVESFVFIVFFFFKKRSMICNIGFSRLLFIQYSIIWMTISLLFNGYENATLCLISVLFRHTGIIFLTAIFSSYINYAQKLGIPNSDFEIKLQRERQSSNHARHSRISGKFMKKNSNKNDMYFPKSIDKLKNNNNNNNNNTTYITNCGSFEDLKASNNIISTNQDFSSQDSLFRNLKGMYDTTFRTLIFSVALFLVIIGVGIIDRIKYKDGDNFEDEKLILNSNNHWMYRNPLLKYDITLCTVEFLYFISLFSRSSFIWRFEGIFKINHKIYCSIILLLTLGTFPNILSYFALYKSPKRVVFNLITNTMCYLSIYGLIILHLLFIQFIKKEKDVKIEDYFVCPRKEFCYKHRSYLCGCLKLESDKAISDYINKYIFLYVDSER